MNLDDVKEVWRSQDASPLHGVDKTLLHQALRQEQAKLEKQRRWARWLGYVGTAPLFVTAGLFLAIMFQPNDDNVLIVWDYVAGVVGVTAAVILAGALFALLRSHKAREQGFGDSLRDQLRRRLAQFDDEATRERRLALIMVAAMLICVTASSIAGSRINDVPYSDIDWSPLPIVLIFGFTYLWLFRWAPRWERRKNLPRKRQLEALLKELDGQ